MDSALEILGFCTGLLYLWWEYHANSKMWWASIVMPTISMWIYLSKGLYADFAINIYYFVIAIYGYAVWTRRSRMSKQTPTSEGTSTADDKGQEKKTLSITHISMLQLTGCTAVFILLWGAMYAVLRYLTDSTVPVADSFTTSLSIVAMWMLARKYLEQWIAWIMVDAVCVGLYIYKGIYFYATLYAIYTVIAFFGYRKWLRMMHSKDKTISLPEKDA